MELEVNGQHTRIDLGKRNFLNKPILIRILGIIVIASLFSGCGHKDDVEIIESPEASVSSSDEAFTDNLDYIGVNAHDIVIPDNTEANFFSQNIVNVDGTVNIPNDYLGDIRRLCGKNENESVTLNDLLKIDHLYLRVFSDSDLSWLQYCTNITSLEINLGIDDPSSLIWIKELSNLESLNIFSFPSSAEGDLPDFSMKHFSFMKDMPSLRNLNISYFNIEPGVVESFTQLRNLTLLFLHECDIDYSRLTFLDSLNFNAEPYTAVISCDSNDYNTLIRNGVNVTFSSEGDLNKFVTANKRLDEIVNSLGLDDNASDISKLNEVIICLLDMGDYSEKLSKLLDEHENDSAYDSVIREMTTSFYKDGLLTAFFSEDGFICGTFSGAFDALANRLGLDSIIAYSDTHAWNLVRVNGEYYYVDVTALDGTTFVKVVNEYDEDGRVISSSYVPSSTTVQQVIRDGDGNTLKYYMEDPTKIQEIDSTETHNINNLPGYIIIEPINDEGYDIEIPESTVTVDNISQSENNIHNDSLDDEFNDENAVDITNKKFRITINNKTWIIGGTTLIAILLILGLAKKNKKRRKSRKQTHIVEYDPYGDYNKFYDSGYSR